MDTSSPQSTSASPNAPTIEEQVELWVEVGEGGRMDKFLAKALEEDFSRERLKALIQEGFVQCNGKTITRPSHSLNNGDQVMVQVPSPQPIQLKAEAIPLAVVFEDDHLLIINKPHGMLTHPTGQRQTGTLVNAVLHHCAGSLSGINGVLRPGIVHRLDADTCGLIMVAKTDAAHRQLAQAIQDRQIKREYKAIVQGNPTKDSGTVDAPIGRHPVHRQKMCIDPNGRRALTHWQVLERIHDQFALVHCQLETGRTHQIRVHMQSIGLPLIGDVQYGTGLEKIWKLPTEGQLLQAFRLSLNHPITGEALSFELDLDPRLAQNLEVLKGTPSQ